MPKTSGTEIDEFWDQIPVNDLNTIIDSLCKLCAMLHNKNTDIDMMLFEAAMIAYDIAGQITPRIPELHLGNDYTLGISDLTREGITFEEQETYYIVKQVPKSIWDNDIADYQRPLFNNLANKGRL